MLPEPKAPAEATPETTPSRAPIKHDLYNLDNLIGELNTPKEQIQKTEPRPGFENQNYDESGADDFATANVDAIAPEVAALSGKAIAGTIDTVLSTGLSIYAKAASPDKFEATDKQINKLNLAWQAVSQKYNYKIEDSPWFNVILLTVAIYLPLWNEAGKDRRFAEMDEKLKDLDTKVKENEARLKLIEKAA